MALDWDDVFKLATPKYVYIRDRKLGILKYFFMIIIFLYVVVYQIFYSCTHLSSHVAHGFGVFTLRGPVEACVNHTCHNKYRSITKLPYCSQYVDILPNGDAGNSSEAVIDRKENANSSSEENVTNGDGKRRLANSEKVGDFISKQRPCRFVDHDRLTLEEVPNQIFIPLRYVSYTQTMNPDCYDPLVKGLGVKGADQNYRCVEAWVTTSQEEFYVADIGAYTLSLMHSFVAPDIGVAGSSTDYKGFFAACPTDNPKKVKTECKRIAIPNSTGDVAPDDMIGVADPSDMGVPSLHCSPESIDIITLRDLLKLTSMAQQQGWDDDIPDRKMPESYGLGNKSLRESGGMLMLAVVYDNTGLMRPGFPAFGFGAIKPITYTYRPYFLPSKENKKVEVQQSLDTDMDRVVNIWYGITIQMSFQGTLVQFAFAEVLKTFSTGLVLLSSATTIVVALAVNVFWNKAKYLLQMFQFTEDMSDYKKVDDNEPCTSFTGDLLLKSGTSTLTNSDITDILIDYEIRLNRIDGRDPKLAFIVQDDSHKGKPIEWLRENNKKRKSKFFEDCSNRKATKGYQQIASREP